MVASARALPWRARWQAAFVLGCVVAASPARAANEPPAQVTLRYEREPGTEACPSEADLRAAVAARLGYDPFAAPDAPVEIVVRVRRKGAGTEGSIARIDRTREERGRPTTIASQASDCVELGSSLAVALAIAVDPLSLTRAPSASESVPDEGSPPPSDAPEAPEPAPTRNPEPGPKDRAEPPESPVEGPSSTKLLVAVGPSLSTGALPAPSFGVRAAVGASRGIFEASLEGRFDPPVSVEERGGSAEGSLVLATLVPCVHYRFVLGCAQVSVGALRGAGFGFDQTREDSTFYASAGARLGAELPLGRHFAVRGMFEGQVPFRPTRLEVDGSPLWSSPSFAFSAVPMLVGRFP